MPILLFIIAWNLITVTYVSWLYLKITLKNLRTWFSNDFSRNVKITQKGGFLAIPPSKKSLMIWNLLLKMKFSINFDLTYCCYLQNYRGNLKKSWYSTKNIFLGNYFWAIISPVKTPFQSIETTQKISLLVIPTINQF